MKKVFFRIITLVLILSQITPYAYAADYLGHWSENVIQKWLDDGKLSGDDNGMVMPDRLISRAEFVSLLLRSVGINAAVKTSEFVDISISDWYYSAISTAGSLGIVSGTGNGNFMPDAPLTREDAMVMICRAYKISGDAAFNLTDYHDGLDISPYALPYMSFMCENEILTGYSDKTIRPKNSITRAEAVVILERMNDFMSDPTENVQIKFTGGYPKLKESGLTDGYNLLLKTNKPCKIYYTIINPEKTAPVSDKSKIDKFLIEITAADTAVSAYIAQGAENECTIYLKAVDAQGNESKIAQIRNAKKMYYSYGDGSRENPYIVSTEEQLDAIRYFPDKHFKLKNDIILSGKWIPIGSAESQETMFRGNFDGDGYKISNISVTGGDYSGLFGYIYGGTVKNLYASCDKIVGGSSVGIIAGANNGGVIENCFTDGLVRAGGSYAGGIVGNNNGIVARCQSAALAIEAQSYAGGIAGWNSGDIRECMSCTYSVMANMYSSGIAGANSGGTVENCVAANINVTDYMTDSNGRITTNKSGGKTKNNYGYDKMYATVGDCLPSADSQNGLDVSWEMLNDKSFYNETVGWKFDNSWRTAVQTDSFRLPSLKMKSKPMIKEGVTVYAPMRVSTAEELLKIHEEPENHYILTNDIYLPKTEDGKSNWFAVCADDELTENPEKGFSGSLDGDGYSIYNMTIDYEDGKTFYGMFGVVAGGTVRNLNLKDVYISASEVCGAVAAVNYGTVQNCAVTGVIDIDQTESIAMAGGIAGDNYGTIQNSQVNVNINARGNSSTTGGICANNEGVVIDCLAKGNIKSNGKSSASNTAVGGIAGFSADGIIYESCSEMSVEAKAHISYVGGICGMFSGGEIYKTSTSGALAASATNSLESAVYVGGISGLSNGGVMVNSFSSGKLGAGGVNIYAGGISGYNMNCHVQNCYSTSDISHYGTNARAGGIVGFNEGGFVTGNVALNKSFSDNGTVARICAETTGGIVSDNYASEEIKCGRRAFSDTVLDGMTVPEKTLMDLSFYFKPISEGGKLGWLSGEVWSAKKSVNPYYSFPVLADVRGEMNKVR